MNWLNEHGLKIGATTVSYASLLIALAVVLIGFFVASQASARMRSFGGGDAHLRARAFAAQVVGHLLRITTIAVALQVTGIDIASVLAAGAVLAVGIGIAMQKVAENFISGVILSVERSIREGDVIEFDGRLAKVRQIGIRATIAITLDDEEIIVPNSMLAQSAVKNLTLTDLSYRLRVSVGVAYGTDVDRAAEVLEKAAVSVGWREPSRHPVVLLTDFGASSIDFEVSIWTTDAWTVRRGQSELRKALWRALRDAGIEIPFPQIDVHFPDAKKGAPRAELVAGEASSTAAEGD